MSGMKLSLCSYEDRVVTHMHDFQQIGLPVTGTLDQGMGLIGDSISLGYFAVIGPGVQHAFRAFGRNCFVVLDTDGPVVGLSSAIRPLGGNVTDLVRYIAAELAGGDFGAETEFHLVALLARKIQHACGRNARTCDPVETALALMTAGYPEKLTVAQLADAAGLRASQFHTLFRRKTGKTPCEMLTDIRLDRASSPSQWF